MVHLKSDFRNVIDQSKAFESGQYVGLDLDSLIAYVLWVLKQQKIPGYFDYVAVVAWKFFPDKFSMVSFQQYPDNNRVGKTLRRLVDPKRRNWATGSVESGFYLTDAGCEVGQRVSSLLGSSRLAHKTTGAKGKRSRGRSSKEDVADIIQSNAYRKWSSSSSNISSHDVLAMLGAMSYTPQHLLRQQIDQLKESAAEVGDNKVVGFIEWVMQNFRYLFNKDGL